MKTGRICVFSMGFRHLSSPLPAALKGIIFPASWAVIPTVIHIHETLQDGIKSNKDSHPEVAHLAPLALAKLKKDFDLIAINPMCFMATILYPRCKLKFFETKFCYEPLGMEKVKEGYEVV